MSTNQIGRREFITASALIAAAVGIRPSHAHPKRHNPAKLFSGTALAGNSVAATFETVPPGLQLPQVILRSQGKQGRISDFRNRATLVSLWTDWCAPCLSEVHDLAALQERHHGSGFEIVALYQGPFDVNRATAKLVASGGAGLPSWAEEKGASVAEALATPVGGKGFSLPCNLLFDRHGHLRGRAFGSHLLSAVESENGELTAAAKEQLLHVKTAWSLPAADEFARVLAGGLLEKI